MIMGHILLIYIKDPIYELFPFLYYVRAFMAINIHALSGFLAFIPQFELKPTLGSLLGDSALDFQCRENYFIQMLSKCVRCYCAKGLRCEICIHAVKDGFIIEEGVMGMLYKCSGWW